MPLQRGSVSYFDLFMISPHNSRQEHCFPRNTEHNPRLSIRRSCDFKFNPIPSLNPTRTAYPLPTAISSVYQINSRPNPGKRTRLNLICTLSHLQALTLWLPTIFPTTHLSLGLMHCTTQRHCLRRMKTAHKTTIRSSIQSLHPSLFSRRSSPLLQSLPYRTIKAINSRKHSPMQWSLTTLWQLQLQHPSIHNQYPLHTFYHFQLCGLPGMQSVAMRIKQTLRGRMLRLKTTLEKRSVNVLVIQFPHTLLLLPLPPQSVATQARKRISTHLTMDYGLNYRLEI